MTSNLSTPKMIFVIGNSRSGTTLMGSVLGLNTQVFTFEELHFFEQLWLQQEQEVALSQSQVENLLARLFSIQASDYLTQKPLELFRDEAKTLTQKIWHEQLTSATVFQEFMTYETIKHGKVIPLDQTPRNVLYIKEILDLYPESRIINMIRDPRDVLLSQKYKWRIKFLGASNIPYREVVRTWINYHPITMSKLWNASINASDKFADHPRLKTVRFEDFVFNPETVLQDICQFLELEFQPQMLQVSQSQGGVSSHKKIDPKKKGIDPNVREKWKRGGLTKAEIYLCEKITQGHMVDHEYEISHPQVNFLFLLLSYVSFPAKISLALLFNIHRTKNIIESLKRRLA